MAKSVLSDPRFHNEEAAFDYVETQLWPNGPVCPHCGNSDAGKIGRLTGKTTRAGLRKCYACRKPFTVRMGTIFEDSHLPLRMWLQAIHLLCAQKRHLHPPASADAGLRHENRLAPWPPHPRVMAPRPMLARWAALARPSRPTKPKWASRRKTASVPAVARHNVKVLSLVERGGKIRSVVIDHRGIGPLSMSI